MPCVAFSTLQASPACSPWPENDGMLTASVSIPSALGSAVAELQPSTVTLPFMCTQLSCSEACSNPSGTQVSH